MKFQAELKVPIEFKQNFILLLITFCSYQVLKFWILQLLIYLAQI